MKRVSSPFEMSRIDERLARFVLTNLGQRVNLDRGVVDYYSVRVI